jgi:mono/diheme cytochrome c family protein
MRLRQIVFTLAAVLGLAAGTFTAAADQTNSAVTSAPVYVPDYTHAGEPLPDGVIAWDGTLKSVDAAADQDFARFTFSFTNIATRIDIGLATNVIVSTNFTTVTNSGFWARLWGNGISQVATLSSNTTIVSVTNITPVSVTILNVHPSCGCTTAELPPTPWTLAPGTNGTMKVSVNLAGKAGTLFKTVTVITDKGRRDLMLRINIQPPVAVVMTDEQRMAGIAAAKVDRQAIFKGDCASCHLKNADGKYSQALYEAVCGVCHEAQNRATMVPNLAALKVPTNVEFWRTWISFGKPGSLMPAFAASQGGPLNDMQIASLAQFLNAVHPSQAPPPPQ